MATHPKESTAENSSSMRKCADHGPTNVLDLYCTECDALVCSRCLTRAGKHCGHDVIEISEAFKSVKKRILESMQPLYNHISTISEYLKGIEKSHKSVVDQRKVIEDDIHKAIKKLQDMLVVRKADLLHQLDSIVAEKVKGLTAQHDKAKASHLQLSQMTESIGRNLQKASQEEVVMNKDRFMQQIDDLLCSATHADFPMPCSEADMTFSVGEGISKTCQNFGRISVKSLKQLDPCNCHVSGEGLKEASTEEEALVIFSTFNSMNLPCNGPPVDALACEIESELTGVKSEGKVRRKTDNSYEITYQPLIKGAHLLSITINGKHIKNSPFRVHAKLPVKLIRDPIMSIICNVSHPWGAAFTLDGKLVVSECGGHCISVYTSNGARIFTFGGFGSKAGKFNSPCGVAVDDVGNIFVADSENYRIQKFTSDGRFLASAGADILLSAMPVGLAFNPVNKNIYMVDACSSITIINSDLTLRRGAIGLSGTSRGQLNRPHGIACDAGGRIFVADTDNHRVQVFSRDGDLLMEFGANDLSRPVGIAVGRDSYVYVSDVEGRSVVVFNPEGGKLNSFGPGELDGVRGVAVDPDGVVYVCDPVNQKIVVF